MPAALRPVGFHGQVFVQAQRREAWGARYKPNAVRRGAAPAEALTSEGSSATTEGEGGDTRTDADEHERCRLGQGHHGHKPAARQLFGRESEATSNERPDSLIGNKEAVLGPSGYSPFAGRIRSRPGSAVTIPPATSDSP